MAKFVSGTRYYHAPSAGYFEMRIVNGRPQQRRWQLVAAGKEINSVELDDPTGIPQFRRRSRRNRNYHAAVTHS